jgi:hypothetical protein
MGNWSSSESEGGERRGRRIPISEAEWNAHEGNKYVILPHYLQDEEDSHRETEEQGRRRGPRWPHIEEVLRRKINDVDELEKGTLQHTTTHSPSSFSFSFPAIFFFSFPPPALSDLVGREVGCYFFHEFYSKPTEEAKRFFEVILPTIQRLALRCATRSPTFLSTSLTSLKRQAAGAFSGGPASAPPVAANQRTSRPDPGMIAHNTSIFSEMINNILFLYIYIIANNKIGTMRVSVGVLVHGLAVD